MSKPRLSPRRHCPRGVVLTTAFVALAMLASSAPAHAQGTPEDAAKALPGLSLVPSTVTREDDDHHKVVLQGFERLSAGVFRAGATSPWRGWIKLTGEATPKLDEHGELATVTVANAFVVLANDSGPLKLTDLPADERAALEPYFEGAPSVTIGQGVNLFLQGDISSGAANQLVSAGLRRRVRVTGTVGAALIARALGKPTSDPKAAYGKVTITFDNFTPTEFKGLPPDQGTRFGLTLQKTKLWGERSAGGYTLGGSFRAVVKAWGQDATIDGQLGVTSAAAGKTISLAGSVDIAGGLVITDLLPGLKLSSLGVSATFGLDAASTKQVALQAGLDIPSVGAADAVVMVHKGQPSSRTGVIALASLANLDVLAMLGAPDQLTLDRTVVMVSTIADPAPMVVDTLPATVKALLVDAGLAKTATIQPYAGVRVISKVKVGSGTGPLGGVKLFQGELVIEGAVSARQGKPELDLAVSLPSVPQLPDPVGKYVIPRSLSLFVKLADTGLEAGLRGELALNLPRKKDSEAPVVRGALSVKVGSTGADVQVSTALASDWVDCFGLKDITLAKDTGIAFAAGASGDIFFLTNGNVKVGDVTLGLGGGARVLFSSGIPTLTGLALRAEASELDLLTPVKLGQTAMRAISPDLMPSPELRTSLEKAQRIDFVTHMNALLPTQEPLKSMARFAVKGPEGAGKVMVYLATPGMEKFASQLKDFSDAGVKVAGSLWFGDKQLGSIAASVTTKGGVDIKASSAVPIPVHPLIQLESPALEIKVDPANLLASKFALSGQASFFGLAKAGLAIALTSTSFQGAMTQTIGGLESARLELSAAVGGPSDDLKLTVVVDPAKAILGLKEASLRMLGSDADATARRNGAAELVTRAQIALEVALHDATKDRQKNTENIAKANERLSSLEDRERKLGENRSFMQSEIPKALAQLDLPKATRMAAELAALAIEEAALAGLVATARAALSAASAAVSWTPVRLYPTVILAQGQLDAARIAAEALALSDAAREEVKSALNQMAAAGAGAIVLQSFELRDASLKAALGGAAQTFVVNLRINGKDVTYEQSYKLSAPGQVSLDPVGGRVVGETKAVPTQAELDARVATLGLGYGDVRYYKDQARDGTRSWIAAKRIGAPGWGELAVAFGGWGGNIYGVTHDRAFVKMTDQSRAGEASWSGPTFVKEWPKEREHRDVMAAGGWNGHAALVFKTELRIWKLDDLSQVYADPELDPNGNVMGQIPKFTRIFGGQDFVYYLTTWNGELWCYRAKTWPDGRPAEPESSANGKRWLKRISTGGWNDYSHVFGGANGVIYAVDPEGKLIFRHHTGRDTCTDAWGPKDKAWIGSGWNMFQSILGGEDGVIYAVPRQTVPVTPGATVALYSPTSQRFLRAHKDLGVTNGSDRIPYGRLLPPGWTWERWTVVDTRDGQVGLWNPDTRRFMKMEPDGKMTLSPVREDGTLPSDWHYERFEVRDDRSAVDPAPRGTVRLYSRAHSRYVLLNHDLALGGQLISDRVNGYPLDAFEVTPAPAP